MKPQTTRIFAKNIGMFSAPIMHGKSGQFIDDLTPVSVIGLAFINDNRSAICPVSNFFASPDQPPFVDAQYLSETAQNCHGENYLFESWKTPCHTVFPLVDPYSDNPFEYLKDYCSPSVQKFAQKAFAPLLSTGISLEKFKALNTRFMAIQLESLILNEDFTPVPELDLER